MLNYFAFALQAYAEIDIRIDSERWLDCGHQKPRKKTNRKNKDHQNLADWGRRWRLQSSVFLSPHILLVKSKTVHKFQLLVQSGFMLVRQSAAVDQVSCDRPRIVFRNFSILPKYLALQAHCNRLAYKEVPRESGLSRSSLLYIRLMQRKTTKEAAQYVHVTVCLSRRRIWSPL